MNQYLTDTQQVVQDFTSLLRREREQLNTAARTQAELKDYARELFEGMKKSGFSSEVIMDVYGFEQAADDREPEIVRLRQLIAHRHISHQAIAGAILQIAKQGISIVHGGLANCLPGRAVGSELLKNIVWQARNQSMHYEDGRFHQPVIDCFATLEREQGTQFHLRPVNLALQVVTLLGWEDFAKYEADMQALLP